MENSEVMELHHKDIGLLEMNSLFHIKNKEDLSIIVCNNYLLCIAVRFTTGNQYRKFGIVERKRMEFNEMPSYDSILGESVPFL